MPLIPYIFATWKFINFKSMENIQQYPVHTAALYPLTSEKLNQSGNQINKTRYTMLWAAHYLVLLVPENKGNGDARS